MADTANDTALDTSAVEAVEAEQLQQQQEDNVPAAQQQQQLTANAQQHAEEFAYLQRNEFCAEMHKIELRNLGRFGMGELKKLLKQKLQLNVSKIKTPMRKEFAFICLRSAEEQQRAIEILNGYKWKGKILQALTAKACADPLIKRRKTDNSNGQGNVNGNGVTATPRTAADAACPWHTMPYDEQLQQKHAQVSELLRKFHNKLQHTSAAYQKLGQRIEFLGVQPSPQIDGYRNKNEFTVGSNAVGEIVVGFRLGRYAHGSVEVADVQTLPHIPAAAKWAARTYQQFICQSTFLPYNPADNTGHFRQLMVRTSSASGEIMLVAGIYSSNLNDEQLLQLQQQLRVFYSELPAEPYKCTSLYYQDVKQRECGQLVAPVQLLMGATHIKDKIHELTFSISPLAFFQINSACANVLYQQAIELATPSKHSIVLDICCGTGTIALCFAQHCKQVLGIELIPEAIEDAKLNAQMNGIENSKFYAGNANDYIETVVRELQYNHAAAEQPIDIVAVVDPPRAGLHIRSIMALRAARSIKRLVYMACNAEHAQQNWLDLGRAESKQYKGEPFYAKKAIAVDMFPHTSHVELVLLFERHASAAKNAI